MKQILFSDINVNNTLAEWESKKVQPPENETPISVVNVNNGYLQSTRVKETESKPLYPTFPSKGDVFGKIIIPRLNKELPIIHGTDQRELAKGVGHYIGSVFPGEPDNAVLAGHRDTVFRGLGQVKIGDLIYVETTAGNFTYEIVKQRIVNQDDRSVIVPFDKPVLTLVTCYPFDFVGPAPDRYILIGELVKANTKVNISRN
jgi:sortase A